MLKHFYPQGHHKNVRVEGLWTFGDETNGIAPASMCPATQTHGLIWVKVNAVEEHGKLCYVLLSTQLQPENSHF